MSPANPGPILQSRCYSADLQQLFVCLSGDRNPLHVDPIVARRTFAGSCAVHGIHQALSSLEALLAEFARQNRSDLSLAGFKAQFLKPVLVGEIVTYHLTKLTDETCLITGRIAGEIVCRISIQFGTIIPTVETGWLPLPPEPVTELPFAALAGQTGHLTLGLDALLARQLFPLTTAMLGTRRLAATLALSRLVGMHCPGLHSIFAEATVRYNDTAPSDDGLHYRVEEADELYVRIVMSVHGSNLQGQLVAFFRPSPQLQLDMAEVKRWVEPGSFAQSIALIVGGSRGLGEITARLIAAGGGLPIITYHQGTADAERIVDDIRSAGGRCKALQLDVRHGDTFIQQLSAEKHLPRSLYYYATPKIFGRRHGFFDHDLLHEFQEVYVTAFGRLVDAAATICPTTLRVFYPSSVAVTETMRELTEYAMAKRTGEELCAFYNQHAKQIEIIVERLPRIRTDQTSTLLPAPAEDGLKIMLPLVHRMEGSLEPPIPRQD